MASPRRLFLLLGAAFLVLLVVLVVRAASLSSRQIRVDPVDPPVLDAEAIVERYRAGLRIRTISHHDPARFPTEAFEDYERFHAESFPRLHETLSLELVSGHTMLFTWSGTDPDAPPVVLMGHHDVVPAEPESAWTHPPFSGDLVDGVIWGRGAIDNKSSVMMVSEAVEHLLSGGFRPRRTVMLSFGHDEEIGGPRGASEVARILGERGVVPHLVVDEGGAMVTGAFPFFDRPIALVGVAEKGSLTVELAARLDGPAHSSVPPDVTPVGRVARAVERLQSNQFPPRLTDPVADTIDFLAPELPFAARLVAANRWLFDPLLARLALSTPTSAAMVRTTTAPTMMSGSPKANVIPPEATVTVNFRVLTGETAEDALERVRTIVADEGIELRRQGRFSDPSSASRVDTEGFASLHRSIAEVFPEAVVVPYLLMAGTDARYFHPLGPSVYRFQPGRFTREAMGLAHGVDERISVENLLVGVGFFVRLLENVAGPTP